MVVWSRKPVIYIKKRIYRPIDAIDKISARPDFAIAVYPGHLWINHHAFKLNKNLHVTKNTPPTFIVQAENDPVDSVNNSLVYYIALKKAGVPVEMHLYAEGRPCIWFTTYVIPNYPLAEIS